MSSSATSQGRVVHYCPQVGLAALFRPLPKNDENRPALNVIYQPFAGKTKLEFSAKLALGIPEQTLLLVLLELARQQFVAQQAEMILDCNSTGEVSKELWSRLNHGDLKAPGTSLLLMTTWYELNRRCGTDTGGSLKSMRMSQLKRLCEVVVWQTEYKPEETTKQSFLVVWLVGDDKKIHLALNAKLASALMGGPYAQVSLSERHLLKKDVAKAVHAFLSTTIASGNSLRVGVETLIERFWPGSGKTAPPGSHRRHRGAICCGLKSIGRLEGWNVIWEREDLVKVVRQSIGVRKMTCHKASKTASFSEQAFAIITSKNNDLQAFDASGLFFNKNTGS